MTKRLRVFAGPNGSGKSTIIDIVRSREINLGVYENEEITIQDDEHTPTWFFKYILNKL